MGFRSRPIEHTDWFERYEHSLRLNHQPINSDGLEGAIRNPIQQGEVIGRVLHGSVCSLPFAHTLVQRGALCNENSARPTSWNKEPILRTLFPYHATAQQWSSSTKGLVSLQATHCHPTIHTRAAPVDQTGKVWLIIALILT